MASDGKLAAPVLAGLGLFGGLRVVFDLMVAYLLARGRSRAVLLVQVLWFVTLVPAIIVGTRAQGIAGAAWAHLVVAIAIVLPAYLLALHRAGADIGLLATSAWPPLVAGVAAATVGWSVSHLMTGGWSSLLLGGLAAGLSYLALVGSWVRRAALAASAPSVPLPSPLTSPHDLTQGRTL